MTRRHILRHVCESCLRRPATTTVTANGTSFKVCDSCAPLGEPVPTPETPPGAPLPRRVPGATLAGAVLHLGDYDASALTEIRRCPE